MSEPAAPADLRMHGNGDGSVSLYCGVCRDGLPPQPRPLTLGRALSAWREHAAAAGHPPY